MNSPNVNPQKAHYEKVHDAYEKHYYDNSSLQYRREFIYTPLFKGFDLSGARLADFACGSGHNSIELRTLFPGISTTGYDISQAACEAYVQNTGGKAHQVDLTNPFTADAEYDAVLIVGGLHHCISNLDAVFLNIARVLKPNGYLFMVEPNEEFFLNSVRNIWYKKDKWFEAESESALRHDEILELAKAYFEPHSLSFFGGPAFYLILNSLITRVPLKAKPFLAPILFPLESLFNQLPGRSAFAAFRAVWRKR
ncbi:class I SAM-dependent methyltransferase [Desulfovibrio mangrovi]|uniref:class I SAM-dependent methyltransferase n=1 Tax=Desulfovibrio mangrovi TaxID=2976983 RepID=UPI002245BEE9|nr:class I SAM-dependent methyltransferase [Desulfovibrio mangrovi]UZP65853.1 class I SAM-dependent methyltransferase [Desulfovibrio mangrovi]